MIFFFIFVYIYFLFFFFFFFFFFNHTAPPEISTLSLHDALPISPAPTTRRNSLVPTTKIPPSTAPRSMTAGKATAPLLLIAGRPKRSKVPPRGVGSPPATSLRNTPSL